MGHIGGIKNEIGNKYGKLTVINRAGSDKRGLATWECLCECGNKTIARGADLRSGNTKSCGCYKVDKTKEKIKDITGLRFGKLTVMYQTDKRSGNNVMWHCKCDCGNEKDISGNSLVRGVTQSCGCLHNEQLSALNFKDLTGQKFGLLTVLYRTENNSSQKILWHCKCSCGNEKDILGNSLTSGRTMSCGCLKMSHGELKIFEILQNNNIVFKREYTPKDCNLSFKPRYDFYLPDLKCFIEYDGIQHFNKNSKCLFNHKAEDFLIRQEHDKAKNIWAKENGYTLIRIPYSHYNSIKIEDLLPDTSTFII